MEGISKESVLVLLAQSSDRYQDTWATAQTSILEGIVAECKELDPWLPIESAPLRKEIRLYSREEGQIDSQLFDEEDRKYFTHWREATEDPKG